MNDTIEKTRTEVLNKIIAMARKNLPEKQAELIVIFIGQYYANISVEDLCERPLNDLYGFMLAHWNLLYQRQPMECKVHTYNPSFEQHGWQSTH